MSASLAGPARLTRVRRYLLHNLGLNLALALLVLVIALYCGVYFAQQGRLPGNFELTSTVDNTMPLVLAAIAQTLVVLTRGIDLSIGGMMDLTNALAAAHMKAGIGSMLGWSALILAVGAGLGLVNGLLVAYGRLQPILVTLATLSIFQGLAIRVLPDPGGAIPQAFTDALVNTSAPWALVYVVALALLWLGFRRSALGVALFAVGNDERAARANGIDVIRTKIAAYMMAGVFAALAGLVLAATATSGDATTGDGFTLRSVVAVVLGGVSLFGGRGSAIGAMAGAFITMMIVNVLFFSSIDPLYQSFFEGLFLVVVVVLGAVIGGRFRRG
ncbi:MAG: ABC transporter permease [Acetobacteraceae bacterium]